MNERVQAEVDKAYADCWKPGGFEVTSRERNLNFRASESVPRDEAVKIMRHAVPGCYNAFTADLLLKLPEDCNVTLAREYSVCVYVDRQVSAAGMDADECDFEDGMTRIWWD